MHDLALDDGNKYGSGIVFVFFGSFKFISDYICINLMVGIILDTFDNTYSTEKLPFSVEDLWWFRDEWARLCTAALVDNENREPAVRESLARSIQKNPTRIQLPFECMRALLLDMERKKILNFNNMDMDARCYCLLQCEMHAAQPNAKKAKKLPKVSMGAMMTVNPKDKAAKKKALEKVVADFGESLDFDSCLKRLVLFSLGRESLMYADMMNELDAEKRWISRQIIDVCIRSWISLSVAKNAPHRLPEVWRDKPQLYRKSVVGMRNIRLQVLTRLRRMVRSAFEASNKHSNATCHDGFALAPSSKETPGSAPETPPSAPKNGHANGMGTFEQEPY